MSNKLYVVDLDGEKNNAREIHLEEFISEENLKKDLLKVGLVIGVERIEGAEDFVKAYFSKKGYNVVRTEYRKVYYPNDTMECVNRELYGLWKEGTIAVDEELPKSAIEAGVPDFFCYKPKNPGDWFFVEVKSQTDALRFNQVQWIIRNKYKTKVIYVERDCEEDE